MLKILKSPTGYIYLILALLQLLVISGYDLFVDEAFYWLEGQHLAWSYAELPGWTAWISAFSEWLFPHHPFFLRLIPWTAALSVPWMAYSITQLIHHNTTSSHFALVWALPLMAMVATLALPDVWLLFFAFLTVWLTLLAIKRHQIRYFILLGICLALGLNVHVRFWIFAFICGVCVLWVYRHHHSSIKKLLLLTFPISLIGLIPIILFNVDNQFPLLNFQFKDRHPWTFQLNHLWFFLVQVVVCTPLVFALCISGVKKPSQWRQLNNAQKLIVAMAAFHWLLYAVLGFFSDTLRLNIHWPLISYCLILAAFDWHQSWLYRWAKYSGLAAHLVLLLVLIYWHHSSEPSAMKLRITQHAIGWQQLAQDTDALMKQHKKTHIIADQFMTASQLAYEQNNHAHLSVVAHPLNNKHGRTPQLQIMGMLHQGKAHSSDLIVVEQTALKLQDQIEYFNDLCQTLGGLKWLAQSDIESGSKSFHFFESSSGQCDLPVIFYGDANTSGWVLSAKNSLKELKLTESKQALKTKPGTLKGNDMFNSLNHDDYQLIYYSCPECKNNSYQVTATSTNGNQQTSQRFYP